MKYVKLFENWLLEADGGGVKPFDPSKPGETLVVDINGDDFKKGGSALIKNILAKCFEKTEDISSDDKITIKELEIDGDHWDSDNSWMIFKSKEDSGAVTIKFDLTYVLREHGSTQDFRINIFPKSKPCYIVSVNNSNLVKETKYGWAKTNAIILKNPKTFLISFHEPIDKGTDSVLNIDCTVFDLTLSYPKEYRTTFGSVCALTSADFKEFAVLKNKDAGTPKNIAKALGYEIPDNYTPKQGGIKKEGKKA
jgi:hypothetical protein